MTMDKVELLKTLDENPGATQQASEDDNRQYEMLIDLWISENDTKTNKLQMLALVNSILFTGFVFVDEPAGKLVSALIGLVFSVLWVFSIGNTLSHQKEWQRQIRELEQRFPQSFNIFTRVNRREFPIYGRVASVPILIGVPVFATLAWLIALILLWL
jgi:hypothetical protein